MTVALLITALGFFGAHLARRDARRAARAADERPLTTGRRDLALDLAWVFLGALGTPRPIWLVLGWAGLAWAVAMAAYPLYSGASAATW